jgi:serine/threonine-protein kinase
MSGSGGFQSAAVLRIVSSANEPAAGRPPIEAQAANYRDGVMIPRRRRLLEKTAAALVGALITGLVVTYLADSPSDGHFRRWGFTAPSVSSAAISPDGKYILFAQAGPEPGLWIRPIHDESPRRLSGAEDAASGFWSPDSRFLGFAADGMLKKLSVDGGDPVVLCPLPNSNTSLFAGGAWSPDGEIIVFSSGARLLQVSAAGGVSKPLFPEDERQRGSFRRPQFLPLSGQSRTIVYSVSTNFRDRRLEVMDLESGERRDLVPGSAPIYSPGGYLIYGPPNDELRGLMALPFSLETLEPIGDAFHLNQDGIGASVSQAGDLVYWDNPRSVALHRLAWRDRATGRVLEPVGEAQFAMRDPVISPDGQRVLVTSAEVGDSNLYVQDLRRSTKRRLTSGAAQESGGNWSADGSKVVFWRQTGDKTALVEKAANSGGAGTVLYEVPGAILNLDWSRDGRYLILLQHADAGSREIRYLSTADLGKGAASTQYPGLPARNASPRISPNGRYLAYESRESNRVEVFVGSFPDGNLFRRKVSNRGGRNPRWSRDGKELYYRQGDALMAVSVQPSSGGITLGNPEELFSTPNLSLGFAPSLDGQRFLTIEPVGETPPPAVHVVENWHDGLDRSAAEAGFGW